MRNIKYITIFLLFSLITGCASRPTQQSTLANREIEQKEAFFRTVGSTNPKGTNVLAMVIPSAGNVVSNLMMVAAIQSGTNSTAIVQLFKELKKSDKKAIGVMSDSDMVAATTVEAALKLLQGFKPSSKLYFVGSPRYIRKLKALADSKGINFEGISYS